ncbi:hypothetical protein SERLA73DRAFT_180266 [Serpula lacrymans var. lacrymans S7.3]|uniref:peptidyl-tRNA hydrolase n=2 Tax=Serpula lacrymans var. lacrymans TaxID=341189 RepID=F8PWD1_SERL3|nr:uncharacterized protein SERLADRAFT_465778 [Serpula lacrymans var. lacrymans S7.9]EGN99936.1 hypothetical protein SERLA73DRAFT_180266 [Serpula lacrymans var. lacrymans S7.3]EGO25504.1 hypothetical protein SERLADRAFT_465778 [Serpula lacrymans var. lacrymans S7.9]
MSAVSLLVVGLGNLPFPLTRHSVGHLIVDALALRLGVSMTTDRTIGGYSAHTAIPLGETLASMTLYKPKPLMNVTGSAVVSALRKTVKSPSAMVVIHDSLSHRPKTISPKYGGSANGHNGVRSLISALGGEMDFHRLRIGIGRDGGDVAEYVLGELSFEEKQFWRDSGRGVDLVLKEIEKIASRTLS